MAVSKHERGVRRLLCIAGGTVLATAALTPASAQLIAPETATHSFAPSDVTPQPLDLKANNFNLTPGLSTGYDDNIFRVNGKNLDKTQVYMVSPSVEGTFDRILGRNQVSLSGNFLYDIFTNVISRSRPQLALNGRATLKPFGACSATPYVDFRRERSDYGDINARIDNNQSLTRTGAILTCDRTAGFFPSLTYEHFTTRNTRIFDYADQTTNTYIAGVGYRKPSLGQVLLYYRRDDVDRPTLGFSNKIDRGGVTFRRDISSILAADIDLSYISVNSTNGGIRDYNGLGWNVELTSRALPFAKIIASTSRSIVNDSLLSGGYVIQSIYQLGLERQISELTTVAATADYLTRKLRQTPELVRNGLEHDKYLVASLRLRRKITTRFAIDLAGSHYLRRTNTGITNFDANRVTLGGSLTF